MVASPLFIRLQNGTREWKLATVASIFGGDAVLKRADGKTAKTKRTDLIPLA